MPQNDTTDAAVRCRYPYLCGEEWCDCNLSSEDIAIMDENVRRLGDHLILEDQPHAE